MTGPAIPRTLTPLTGRTIREAVDVACEGLNGDLVEWVAFDLAELREHITRWVLEYASNRGVVLDVEKDIKPEIDDMVRRVKARIRSNWP